MRLESRSIALWGTETCQESELWMVCITFVWRVSSKVSNDASVLTPNLCTSLKDKKMKDDMDRWKNNARTSAFRQGLLQITEQVVSGESYVAEFPIDVNVMD